MTQRRAHALIVGVSRYLHQARVGPISFAHEDAGGIAKVLKDPKFSDFPIENLHVLIDESATCDAIVTYLTRDLPRHSSGDELFFFFFAGHGILEPAARGDPEGYLVPYDGDPENLARTAISMGDLTKWLTRLDAEALVVCLDCCHAGQAWRGGAPADEARIRGIAIQPRHFEQLAGRGRTILASCSAEERSLELSEWRHGIFSKYLIDGLRGDGDRNRDGWVTIDELFSFVSEKVKNESARLGVRQTPWMKAEFTSPLAITRNPGLESLDWPRKILTGPGNGEEDDLARLRSHLASRDFRDRESAAAHILRSRSAKLLRAVFPLLRTNDEASLVLFRRLFEDIGWECVRQAVEFASRDDSEDERQAALDVLAFLPANEEVIRLLGRIKFIIPSAERFAAQRLQSRKRLALRQESVAETLRQAGSPYILQRALGEGLLTATFSARHEGMRLDLVVRVLRREMATSDEIREGFLDASRRCASIVHQHVVHIRDIGEFPERDLYYIVREYAPGVTLQQFLEQQTSPGMERNLKILRQIASALQAFHEHGVFHGDLKPLNIFLVDQKDGSARVKVGDPGVPGRIRYFFQHPMAVYDFRYVAPELFQPASLPTARSDLYSLGIVAHEIFSGKPPFEGKEALELALQHRTVDPDPPIPNSGDPLTGPINAFVLRLLAKDAATRPRSAEEVITELDRLLREREKPFSEADLLDSLEAQPEDTLQIEVGSVTMQNFYSHVFPEVQPSTSSSEGGWFSSMMRAKRPTRPPDFPGYQILGPIGSGGMASVYLAFQVNLKREVAIKVFRGLKGNEAFARFTQEGEVLAKLNHPNILQIYDLVTSMDDALGIVMEFCPAGTLHELIRKNGRLEASAALRFARQVAHALAYAHSRGIMHRDVKPSNLFLFGDTVKLGDFGLAGGLEAATYLTWSEKVLGTPYYVSPEQARGSSVDARTDLYSLGITLFEMLVGKPPLSEPGAPPLQILARLATMELPKLSSLNPNLDDSLDSLVLKMIARDPDARYQTADEVIAAIDKDLLAIEKPEGPPPERSDSRLERPPRKLGGGSTPEEKTP